MTAAPRAGIAAPFATIEAPCAGDETPRASTATPFATVEHPFAAGATPFSKAAHRVSIFENGPLILGRSCAAAVAQFRTTHFRTLADSASIRAATVRER